MVDALDEKVMKDILSMGLEKGKKKHNQSNSKSPMNEAVGTSQS